MTTALDSSYMLCYYSLSLLSLFYSQQQERSCILGYASSIYVQYLWQLHWTLHASDLLCSLQIYLSSTIYCLLPVSPILTASLVDLNYTMTCGNFLKLTCWWNILHSSNCSFSLSLLPSPQLFSLHWSQIALYPNHLTSLSFIHLCLLLSTSYNPILLSLFHAVSSRPSPCPLHTCTDPLHHLTYYPFLAPSHFEGHK